MYDFDDESEFDDESGTAQINDSAGYICDSCGEEIVVPLDFSEGTQQKYVEDCPVCCNPNLIFVEFDFEGVPRIWSQPEQDH
ncbi:MAG: CPXCG motif-containing cysteine-rich protein [Planctomycetota bacterium]